MRERLEQRVSELKAEHEKGQRMLAEIDARQAELRQTLMRISGAIQVLEELLARPESSADGVTASASTPVLGDALSAASA